MYRRDLNFAIHNGGGPTFSFFGTTKKKHQKALNHAMRRNRNFREKWKNARLDEAAQAELQETRMNKKSYKKN